VWVNNAGVFVTGPAWEQDQRTRELMLEVNATGTINGTLAALDPMRAAGRGHIVNIVSLAGLAAAPGQAIYSASKHAAIGFSLATLADLRLAGIEGIEISCVWWGAAAGVAPTRGASLAARLVHDTGQPLPHRGGDGDGVGFEAVVARDGDDPPSAARRRDPERILLALYDQRGHRQCVELGEPGGGRRGRGSPRRPQRKREAQHPHGVGRRRRATGHAGAGRPTADYHG
jgi:NAD(P)-dependent dehydrogenase (short-subunit alcohol dehydrogenase family)